MRGLCCRPQTPEPHSPRQGGPGVLSRPCTAIPIFRSPPAHLGTREACGSLPIPSPPRPGAPLGMPAPHPDFAQAPDPGFLGARHRERPGEPRPLDMTTAGQRPLREAQVWSLLVVSAPSRTPVVEVYATAALKGQHHPPHRGRTGSGPRPALRHRGGSRREPGLPMGSRRSQRARSWRARQRGGRPPAEGPA